MPLEVLTEQDKQAVLQALRDLQDVMAEIERAKRAGLDVTELEQRARALQQQLEGIRRVYITETPRTTTRATR